MARLSAGLLISKKSYDSLKPTPQIYRILMRPDSLLDKEKTKQWLQLIQKHQKEFPVLSSRESITVVETINAEGKIIPPLLIPKGKVHLEEWYRHIQDEEWLIAPASNGFITDEIAFEWLQDFEHYSRHSLKEWWLLLMDNHKTHFTLQFC
jgi:DDE superfamily endonuclease